MEFYLDKVNSFTIATSSTKFSNPYSLGFVIFYALPPWIGKFAAIWQLLYLLSPRILTFK